MTLLKRNKSREQNIVLYYFVLVEMKLTNLPYSNNVSILARFRKYLEAERVQIRKQNRVRN